MMNNLAGAKFRIVTGYAGSKEIGLAVERNEVQGACGIGWTGFTTLYPHWFEKKLVTMTLQLAVKGHADAQHDGRAAGDRIRAQQGRPSGHGAGAEPGPFRPSVCAAAGRAG